MPRRKQVRPQRMKWEEGGEGNEPNDAKEPIEEELNSTSNSNNESQVSQEQQNVSDNENNCVEKCEIISQCDKRDNKNLKLNLSGDECAPSFPVKPLIKSTNKSYNVLNSQISESDVLNSQQSSSRSPPTSHMETDVGAPLDFSIKTHKQSKKAKHNSGPIIAKENSSDDNSFSGDTPLDLSLGKRPFSNPTSNSKLPAAKLARFESTNSWNYSIPKELTTSKQASNQLQNDALWDGKLKNNILNNKLSAQTLSALSSSPSSSSPSSISQIRTSSGSHGGRQNPWQTQWINRSSEQTRDVFTCVWCKESFRSLAEMTDHMKKSPRCGMAGMQQAATATHNSTPTGAPPPTSPHQPSALSSSSTSSTTTSKEPISSSVLAKNNVGLPRKLVRGQDVWLGRGAEQTRQILKCMWCGQSFKTLADMTTHMKVTQHYTNIISQEQIISWRTPEDKLTQAQVNAVLTCKVCDEAFGSLKELSYHMVKNAHYKEHILRSITEGGHGRRRQTRERRKKSLPVRKLLELERREVKNEKDDSSGSTTGTIQLIKCDQCHERIEAKNFISHIKACKLQTKSISLLSKKEKSPERVKSPGSSGSQSRTSSRGQTVSPQVIVKSEKSDLDNKTNENVEKDEKDVKENDKNESPEAGFGSVLNAIEKLIEKSFDSKSRKTQATGILQRLGIDEEVCPPWQNLPNTPWARGSNEFFSTRTSSRSSGRHSTSPLPADFSRESNGSISSPHTSDGCDDSNSSIGDPMRKSPNININSSSKLSFPISSLISENNKQKKCDKKERIASSSSESHSENSCSPNPKLNDSYTKAKFDSNSDVLNEKNIQDNSSEAIIDCSENREQKLDSNLTRAQHSEGRKRNKSDDSDNASSAETDTFHPLMQLQKLLDKTDSGSNKNKIVDRTATGGVAVPTSLLAFSWACTDAMSSGISNSEEKHKGDQHLMKCAFCETHFISKGAYRHHLSKMHFIKADKQNELTNSNSNTTTNANNNNHTGSDTRENGGEDVSQGNGISGSNNASETTSPPATESPHSKFLKYTELAKQLSSKYV